MTVDAAMADRLEHRILKRFHKALAAYSLIEDGDRILVGLSGGKDSLCLLELLARRMRVSRPAFSVDAMHIRMDNIRYETDTAYLQDFCGALGVRLHVATTGFETRRDSKKPVCFLCSWYRRKLLFNAAQELGCNKIALGHHKDDIVQTAMMNLFSQGHFATMPAKLTMRKMPLAIIRPLCMEDEADIEAFAAMRGYEKQLKSCPYEKVSSRDAVRRMLAEAEQVNPDARHSVFNALQAEGKLVE